MPAGKFPVWYWDACIFLAWIKGEVRTPGEMEGIEEMVDDIEKGQAAVVTSVLTRIEVLESTLGDKATGKFENLLKRRLVVPIAMSMRIADRAHQIRDFYQAKGQKLATPDSIHLASAIIYGADVFYTFDGSAGKQKKRNMRLIPLNGDVAGHPLQIRVPHGQLNLFSQQPTPSSPSPSAPQQPASQSPVVEPATAPSPAQAPQGGPRDAPAPPQPGSSPDVEPPPQSKQ